MGKTVALGELRRRARRSFATVHVTADREGHLSARLAEAVASTLADEEVDRSGRRWSRLAERLAAFDLSVSVAGVLTVGTSARLQAAQTGTPGRDDLRRLVEDVCDQVVEAGRAGLLLTVDEVQEPPAADLTGLVSLLQDLAGGERPVVVVLAGLPATPERLMAAGSFAERFAHQRLSNLTHGAATAAVLVPTQEQGVAWSLDAADLVLSLSRGAPFLLQLYADGVWRAAGPERGGRLELEPARAGVLETEHRLWESQYRGRWSPATPAEQALLAAIAARMGADGVATMLDVAAHLGRPVKSLGPARAALVDGWWRRRPVGCWCSPCRASRRSCGPRTRPGATRSTPEPQRRRRRRLLRPRTSQAIPPRGWNIMMAAVHTAAGSRRGAGSRARSARHQATKPTAGTSRGRGSFTAGLLLGMETPVCRLPRLVAAHPCRERGGSRSSRERAHAWAPEAHAARMEVFEPVRSSEPR